MRRSWLAGAGALFLLAGTAAASAQVTSPPVGSARLAGRFQMKGTVTVAVRIRNEHVGETVSRVWDFTSSCATGPCRQVTLVRHRARASDQVMLQRIGAGYYRGNGRFYAPLRCAGRRYARGEAVRFTIQVHITSAAVVNGGVLATAVQAVYVNRRRRNLTPCVAFPGHDSARYTGQLTP